ncbi:MAG: hypothetical protein U9O64_09250 [Campylobacterota bacterium]|nr:hypothetical protein [Campylobacterota bacterium]
MHKPIESTEELKIIKDVENEKYHSLEESEFKEIILDKQDGRLAPLVHIIPVIPISHIKVSNGMGTDCLL